MRILTLVVIGRTFKITKLINHNDIFTNPLSVSLDPQTFPVLFQTICRALPDNQCSKKFSILVHIFYPLFPF